MLDFKYKAFVTRVVDGDTMDVEIDLGFKIKTSQRLRLADVDTPEKFRPSCEAEKEHGLLATAYVTDMVENQWVIVETKKTGKYGRYLAVVYPFEAPEKSLNDLLIENDLIKRDSYE